MMDEKLDYGEIFEANKKLWNSKTPVHIASSFYDNDSFLKGKNSLNDIELEYLQDIKGKKVLHIQCHFGQDSISLARMGAKVVATDISDVALSEARKYSDLCGTDVTFIETNTYDIGAVISDRFDLVFMSYGVTCWLPDIAGLAKIVSDRLLPGGRVLMAEFHPTLMMFDFPKKEMLFAYNNVHVYREEVEETYAQEEEDDVKGVEYFWQHSLEELMMPFVREGLTMNSFREYYYSPYEVFGSHFEEKEKGKYVYGGFAYPVPHVYLMEFQKPVE